MYLQLAGRILLVFMFLTPLRFEMCHADHSKPGWLSPDGSGHCWVQDKAVRSRIGDLAEHPKLLLQRLVDHSCLQTHEGFSQIRFFPDTFRNRRTVDGCFTGAWWSVHG